jgi:hypothetical protein
MRPVDRRKEHAQWCVDVWGDKLCLRNVELMWFNETQRVDDSHV